MIGSGTGSVNCPPMVLADLVELFRVCAIFMNKFGPELPTGYPDGGDLASTWSGDRRLHAEIPCAR